MKTNLQLVGSNWPSTTFCCVVSCFNLTNWIREIYFPISRIESTINRNLSCSKSKLIRPIEFCHHMSLQKWDMCQFVPPTTYKEEVTQQQPERMSNKWGQEGFGLEIFEAKCCHFGFWQVPLGPNWRFTIGSRTMTRMKNAICWQPCQSDLIEKTFFKPR